MLNSLKDKKTKGGSRLVRDGQPAANADVPGFYENDKNLYEARKQVAETLFGSDYTVNHELVPMVPHIDVCIFSPNGPRHFYTLLSWGMSDIPMNIPEDVDEKISRAEVVLYVNEPNEKNIDVVRFLARYPHKNNTWLAYGHTIPNGNPPEPIFKDSILDTVFFTWSVITSDRSFPAEIKKIYGKEVQLLHIKPISTSECNLMLEKGADALFDLFDQNQDPFILNEQRSSYT